MQTLTTALEASGDRSAQWSTNPKAESTLQKMGRGLSQEEADAEWEMPDDTLGSANKKGTPEEIEEGDTPAYRGENERANKWDDPGDERRGNLRQRVEGRMKQMAREMFEED